MPCHQLVIVARNLHSAPVLGRGIFGLPPGLCFSQAATSSRSVRHGRHFLGSGGGGVGVDLLQGRGFFHRFCRGSKRGVRMSSVSEAPAPAAEGAEKKTLFGPHKISAGEIFFSTKLTFAFVNLRPVVPGHILFNAEHLTVLRDILVCPKRVVPRFADLSGEEVTDLWHSAQAVGKKLEPFFGASSLTLAIQDGPEAGQTVPHVHVHILPRKKADFKNNDDIYDEIDKKEKELKDNLNLDEDRKDRTVQEMHEEAAKLRELF